MKHNSVAIIAAVKKLVKTVNDSPRNKFGRSVWKYHLELVAHYAVILARKLGADAEVVILAAYLHDYASLLDARHAAQHHLLGAKLAGEVLSKLGLPKQKIKAVQDCIFSHRGSVKEKKRTLEQKIVASADAMSHFYYLPDMFFLAYGVHKLETEAGAAWLKAKLQRSWNKIVLPEARKMIAADRKLFLRVLNQVLK
ncbi:MAG TPA: HD domain-containing protein [Candidatus Methylomirabilis sp.]|nr:HD domain-containing protein [Candidatus Methylomirabilis sp.]